MDTIIIYEPDEAILDTVSTALQMVGYRVHTLSDQQENVLKIIKSHGCTLVLLDCWLRNYSGELCQRIKVHFPHLPVIAFSCDSQINEHYRKLGFDDYIIKPFDLDQLYQVVRKHLPESEKRTAIVRCLSARMFNKHHQHA
jgi:DNA-binding response OmpR family regulator